MTRNPTRTVIRAMLALTVALTVLLVTAAPASALPPGCEASINGSPVENHQTPASAKVVDSGDKAVVRGLDSGGAGRTKIGIQFDPLPSVSVRDRVESGEDWSGVVDVDDYATYGVGLYKVTGSSDNCSGFAWIRVGGASPFTTVAGIIGAVLALVGLGSAVANVIRARAGGGAPASTGRVIRGSLASGIPLGLGLLILAQQAGSVPITGPTVLAWIVFASSVTGLLIVAVASIGGSSASAGAAGGGPPPATTTDQEPEVATDAQPEPEPVP